MESETGTIPALKAPEVVFMVTNLMCNLCRLSRTASTLWLSFMAWLIVLIPKRLLCFMVLCFLSHQEVGISGKQY